MNNLRITTIQRHLLLGEHKVLCNRSSRGRSLVTTSSTNNNNVNGGKRVFKRSDYTSPTYLCKDYQLHVTIGEDTNVVVKSRLHIVASSAATSPWLILNAEHLDLQSLEVKKDLGSLPLQNIQYLHKKEDSEIHVRVPREVLPSFYVETRVALLNPKENFNLMGLYQDASGAIISQCESQGFRRISPSIDRPDVLSTYDVTIKALKSQFEVLLSNGNSIAVKEDEGSKYRVAQFVDKVPKPCYLFALITLPRGYGALEDVFVNMHNRRVHLALYAPLQSVQKCQVALTSLKQAMKWDEEVFGLSYDWDRMNIVATDSFNFGAMENTSLNVFASKYLVGSPQTSTDSELAGIQSVVAHEFFHNWTGNRITCRSWFELTLKEGLTVFRDQIFSMDMLSQVVKRIEDVKLLRDEQFPEDESGLAHPIRPDQYESITNFYTTTVYEKGAEVIRMVETLLGREGFRKGMKEYVRRHDGQAVTCDDWLRAMGEANGMDFFSDAGIPITKWYSQPGTPSVRLSMKMNHPKQVIITAEQDKNAPIPIRIGFLDQKNPGKELVASTDLLVLKGKRMIFTVNLETSNNNMEFPFVLSALRNFSAPVKLTIENQSLKDLAFLAIHDSDGFNKWESSQRLYVDSCLRKAVSPEVEDMVKNLLNRILESKLENEHEELCAITALTLDLPSVDALLSFLPSTSVNLSDIAILRREMVKAIALKFSKEMFDVLTLCVNTCTNSPYEFNSRGIGRRELASIMMKFLSELDTGKKDFQAMCKNLSLSKTLPMAIRYPAFESLMRMSVVENQIVQQEWLNEFQGKDMLVINKWLRAQVQSRHINLQGVKELEKCTNAYNPKVPDQVRNLIFAFVNNNPEVFHSSTKFKEHYEFLRDKIIELDQYNPQLAARLCKSMLLGATYEKTRSEYMKSCLLDLQSKSLSEDTQEILQACLAGYNKKN